MPDALLALTLYRANLEECGTTNQNPDSRSNTIPSVATANARVENK